MISSAGTVVDDNVFGPGTFIEQNALPASINVADNMDAFLSRSAFAHSFTVYLYVISAIGGVVQSL